MQNKFRLPFHFWVFVGALSHICFILDIIKIPELNILTPHHDDFNAWVTAEELNKPSAIDMHLPIYPAFAHILKWIQFFGNNRIEYVYFFHLVLLILSTYFLKSLCAGMFDPKAGQIAALLYLFYTLNYFYEVNVLNTALCQFLLIAQFYFLYRFGQYGKKGDWLLFLIPGLLHSLMRVYGWALFVPSLIWSVWKMQFWKSLMKTSQLLVFLGLALFLFFKWHSPEPYHQKFGILCYVGNHIGASGLLTTLPGIPTSAEGHAKEARIAAYYQSQGKADKTIKFYWLSKVWEFLVSHPGEFLTLNFKKLLLLFNQYEIMDTTSVYYYEKHTLLKHLPRVSLSFIIPFCFLGIFLSFRYFKKFSVIYAIMIFLVFINLSLYICARYRMPLVPFMCFFAGAGIAHLPTLMSSALRLLSTCLLLVSVFLLTQVPFKELSLEKNLSQMHEYYQNALSYDQKKIQALDEFHRWSALTPQEQADLTVKFASLQCYRYFFESFALITPHLFNSFNEYTQIALLKSYAVTCERIFQIDDAIVYWQKLLKYKPIKHFAQLKIEELNVFLKHT